jgi:hypothetical protein
MRIGPPSFLVFTVPPIPRSRVAETTPVRKSVAAAELLSRGRDLAEALTLPSLYVLRCKPSTTKKKQKPTSEIAGM